jgi:hypothetical protein
MLKPGAISIDIQTGGIYGDIDHCPLPDLLESAEALWSLLPRVKHKGLWGLAKAFDGDCYLYTSHARYKPAADVMLEQDIYRGPFGRSQRPFKLITVPCRDRKGYFDRCWYEPLVGSIRKGKATSNTNGIPDLAAEARAKMAEEKRQLEKQKAQEDANKGKQESMFPGSPTTTGQHRHVVSRVPRQGKPRTKTQPQPETKEGAMTRMF